MAEVKSTKKAPAKKAPAKRSMSKTPASEQIEPVTDEPATDQVQAAVEGDDVSHKTPAAPVTTLTEGDLAMVAQIAAQAAAEAVKVAMPAQPAPLNRHTPGGRQVEDGKEILETRPVSPEETAGWTDEQIAEFNRREAKKLRDRKAKQSENRRDLESMSTAERIRFMQTPRDPSIIRKVTGPGWDGDEDGLIRVRCLRKIGINDYGDMTDIDEEVMMPPEVARDLQQKKLVEAVI